MKKNIILAILFLTNTVNVHGLPYEVSTHAGYNTTQQSSALDYSYSYGIRMNKYINKNNAIGISYNYMNEVEDKNSSKKSNIHRLSINMIHDFQTRYKKIKPYIFAGGGYEYIEDEYQEILSQPFIDYGIGIKYNITDSFNVSADMQAVHKLDSADIDILSSIGVGMVFGAKNREEPKQSAEIEKLPIIQPNKLQPKIKEKIEQTEPIVIAEEPPRRIIIIKRAVNHPIQKRTKPLHRGNYYVQLMTVFKTDLESQRLPIFKELKKRDYRYQIRYPITAGKTSSTLVVGPYQTRDEAKFYLADLKSLKSDAYIVKLKR